MKCAIIQSSYLPWKGYFDIIKGVDTFVFLDDVQYTKNDWRNRNRIKTRNGIKWITVPVKGGIHQKLCDTRIDNSQRWALSHKDLIYSNYSRAEYFYCYKHELLDTFSRQFETLSTLNIYWIKVICSLLNIDTTFINSNNLGIEGRKEDKIIKICKTIGANHYVSGPKAKNYINEYNFKREGITLEFKDYSGYPEYPQPWGEFSDFVSIIDLLFNCGENASRYIWGWREK
jgi:hypothetical protein